MAKKSKVKIEIAEDAKKALEKIGIDVAEKVNQIGIKEEYWNQSKESFQTKIEQILVSIKGSGGAGKTPVSFLKPTTDQPIPGKSFKQLSEQITAIMKPYTFLDAALVANGEQPLTKITLLESIKMSMWNLMNTIFTGRIIMTPPALTPAPVEPPKPAKVAKPKAPKWLTLAIAEVGTKEGPGSVNNPTVLSYWESAKLAWIKDDATPWCAGFANAMLERAGIKGSRAAYARSFLNWGTKLDGPVLGAVTVLNRPPNPTQGHVGFLVAHDAKTVTLVGGNQGDSVCYAKFPKTRVIGYRWPANPPITTPNPVPLEETVSGAAISTSEV